MKKVVFGFAQFGCETPAFIKSIYRTIMFLSGFWVLVIEPRCPGVGEHVKYLVDSFLAAGNGCLYYVCNFFGWAMPANPNEGLRIPADLTEKQENALKVSLDTTGREIVETSANKAQIVPIEKPAEQPKPAVQQEPEQAAVTNTDVKVEVGEGDSNPKEGEPNKPAVIEGFSAHIG